MLYMFKTSIDFVGGNKSLMLVAIIAALQRSKKRVRAVIHTDLPLLISQEFSSNQENEPCAMLAGRCNANAELHRARWSSLFDQMDKSLTEEEKQLVSLEEKWYS